MSNYRKDFKIAKRWYRIAKKLHDQNTMRILENRFLELKRNENKDDNN